MNNTTINNFSTKELKLTISTLAKHFGKSFDKVHADIELKKLENTTS